MHVSPIEVMLYIVSFVFLYHFVCFIVYFIVHAAFVRIKLMMMIVGLYARAY